MIGFPKPIVVVSKCIEFQPVRWNSEIISSDFGRKLKHCVTLIPVCPEVEIGLNVPRKSLRVVLSGAKLNLVQPETRIDLTDKMVKFAQSFLTSLPEVDGFILKSSSHSSAMEDAKVHTGCHEDAHVARVPGVFTKEILTRFRGVTVEDERRLENPQTQDRFLKRVFNSARLRQIKASTAQKTRVDLKPGKGALPHVESRMTKQRELW
jgi:uncharacterized protein YbbK (DUF523 family)